MNTRRATPDDWPAIGHLLTDGALPLAGARAHLAQFLVHEDGGQVVACIGAEVYGTAALLRSAAVSPAQRGRGIGAGLVERLLARLKAHDVRDVVLLTTTAESFFARLGFAAVQRADVPAALAASEEFTGACPESAVAMMQRL